MRTYLEPVTYKIQWLDTPPFGHFMHIAHVTLGPSTGAPYLYDLFSRYLYDHKAIKLAARCHKFEIKQFLCLSIFIFYRPNIT